jgi:hypothetical protein
MSRLNAVNRGRCRWDIVLEGREATPFGDEEDHR